MKCNVKNDLINLFCHLFHLSCQTVAEHLIAQHSAIKMLHSRVKLILAYIKAIENGSLPANSEILREAYALSQRLPVIQSSTFKEEYYTVKWIWSIFDWFLLLNRILLNPKKLIFIHSNRTTLVWSHSWAHLPKVATILITSWTSSTYYMIAKDVVVCEACFSKLNFPPPDMFVCENNSNIRFYKFARFDNLKTT